MYIKQAPEYEAVASHITTVQKIVSPYNQEQ